MQKRGGYCSLGTKDLVAQLTAANRDPKISAIVLDINSPGGQLNGTEELAQAVVPRGQAKIDAVIQSALKWVTAE